MNKFLKSAIFLIIISYSTLSSGEEMKLDREHIKIILNSLSSENEPGLQYIAVNENSVIFEASLGLSDVKLSKPLELKHLMSSFSMTKTITAIAILQLVESKKINIDDQVSKYVEHPYNAKITIKQLISHTSGIPNPIPLKWVHLVKEHKGFDEKKALGYILKKHPDLKQAPNKKYLYSNIGYWLLGRVVEEVTSEKYEKYIIKNVFERVGLTTKEIGFSIKENNAKGYLKKWSFMNLFGRFFIDRDTIGKNEGSWVHINDVYLNGASFGGIVGSAKAFSIILQDLLSKESKLLGASGTKLLYSQQSVASGEKIDMTLGWHIGKLKDITYYYKEGGGAGFHCEMRIYPKQEVASVIMVNRTSFNTRKVLSSLDINIVK